MSSSNEAPQPQPQSRPASPDIPKKTLAEWRNITARWKKDCPGDALEWWPCMSCLRKNHVAGGKQSFYCRGKDYSNDKDKDPECCGRHKLQVTPYHALYKG
ncbi:hypothetical protein BU26DRAFT_608713 [Trematosphaeria pertusa]|uniref:Uncharacterized protein n=1 Tax=Trematosphaeria pertusa TaxID=390896 RepID=A0A6A6I190_9PLEO|nr:uncharacterized protein BU26DRAFT_608713 [Trematosphaeria pertusa]KAF2244264.1 hypothetical protein BU26DRAFT_608713 [Trematosphaeria pertusa]